MILMTGNVKSCLAGKMITEQLILLLRIKLINKNFLLTRMLENDAQNLLLKMDYNQFTIIKTYEILMTNL